MLRVINLGYAMCLPSLDGIIFKVQTLISQPGEEYKGFFNQVCSLVFSSPHSEVEIIATWQDDWEERIHKFPMLGPKFLKTHHWLFSFQALLPQISMPWWPSGWNSSSKSN